MGGLFEVILIFLLTLANGFFSGSEIAIVQARRNRLEERAEGGSVGALKALALSADPNRFLATVQVGITLIGTLSAAFGGASLAASLAASLRGIEFIAPYADAIGFIVVVLFITYLQLVVGELVPKRLALQNSERLAIFAAPFLTTLSQVSRPVTGFLSASVNAVTRLLGISTDDSRDVTEADIVSMVREGTESGAVEAEQAEMIEQVFRLSDRPVRAIMTPRSDIVALSVSATLMETVALMDETRFSRLPVYDGDLDNAIGILNAKDLVRFAGKTVDVFSVRDLLLPAQFVPESSRSDDVLEMLRQTGNHLALVIDEYGAISGMVTMEDVLEELVGDIRDEYDHAEELALVQRADGSWLVDGSASIEDLNEAIGGALDQDDVGLDYTTVGGLVLSTLNRIPVTGDVVEVGRCTLEVMDMDGRRVDKVLLKLAPSGPDQETPQNPPQKGTPEN
ncbi:MAG: hemolysin family protein [Anaerolineae bacterium]